MARLCEWTVKGRFAVGRSAVLNVTVIAAVLAIGGVVRAQVPVTLNGAPVQIVPYATEPGVPAITINPGTPNPFPGGGGYGGGTGGGSGGSTSPSDALNTLMGTPWGAQAIADAQALGVNASALAATCVIESGCQNLSGPGAEGAFQMFPAAFQDGLQAALAADPALASQIVQGDAGRMDPVTEAIAASGYLMMANQSLTNSGIANPTVLDARSYYEFGPSYGAPVANASPSAPLSSIVPASFLSKNNLPANETVGQWRASVSATIGNASGQTVLA